MKQFALFLSMLVLFGEEAYSMSTPQASQYMMEEDWAGDQVSAQYVLQNPVYIDTHLKKKDVTKKSLVTVTDENFGDVVNSFSLALTDAFRDTGKVIDGTTVEFINSLKTQRNLIGKTAKEVMNIFEGMADEQFPAIAEALRGEVETTKFITHEKDGHFDTVRREPVETCCSILFGITYRYLIAKAGEEPNERPVTRRRGTRQNIMMNQSQR